MIKIKSIILKSISLWLILFYCFTTNAQKNLVPNYSFENNAICPSNAGGRPMPAPWYFPTAVIYRNNQYLNSCAIDSDFSVPKNVWGFQYAHTGNAYCGIGTISLQYPNSDRFYVQTGLIDSLKKSKSYYVEFYVSRMHATQYASNGVSLLFTKNALFVDSITDPLGVIQANPQIINYGNPIITDTLNWVKISGIYKSQGGEQFITLGNFKNDNQTNYIQLNNSNTNCGCAEYYLDDVSVIPLDSFCLKADAGADKTITIGDSVFIGSYTNGIDSLKWLQGTTVIDSTRPGFYVKPTANTSYVLHQVVNGCFSSDTVYINVLLPLKFISYSISIPLLGGVRGGSIQNTWQTANETNVSHFNIQRSLNGKDFITIGKVKADNKNYNEYSFTVVLNPPLGGGGALYYRIQSIDKDGKTNYTEIKRITINNKQETRNVIIYPNPAKDYINITSKETIKEIKIINKLSQVVQYLIPNAKQTTINTNQFAKGIYIVQCTNNKNEISTQKLIIQ